MIEIGWDLIIWACTLKVGPCTSKARMKWATDTPLLDDSVLYKINEMFIKAKIDQGKGTGIDSVK